MGYEHSMSAEINFKLGVTIEQALTALQPLSSYHGWDESELVSGIGLPGDDTVNITVEEGPITRMSIYSCGEVGHSYSDLVEAFAAKLEHITEPGTIELRDHDTGDLDNAISTIWFGDPAEMLAAQRMDSWAKAQSLLRDAGVSDAMLNTFAALGQFLPAVQSNDKKLHGQAAALLFREELLNSVHSLTDIAEEHGAATLAAMFYLENAILNNSYIDNDCSYASNVLQIVMALPSSALWLKFIQGSPAT